LGLNGRRLVYWVHPRLRAQDWQLAEDTHLAEGWHVAEMTTPQPFLLVLTSHRIMVTPQGKALIAACGGFVFLSGVSLTSACGMVGDEAASISVFLERSPMPRFT
jgi:hypothetical protein